MMPDGHFRFSFFRTCLICMPDTGECSWLDVVSCLWYRTVYLTECGFLPLIQESVPDWVWFPVFNKGVYQTECDFWSVMQESVPDWMWFLVFDAGECTWLIMISCFSYRSMYQTVCFDTGGCTRLSHTITFSIKPFQQRKCFFVLLHCIWSNPPLGAHNRNCNFLLEPATRTQFTLYFTENNYTLPNLPHVDWMSDTSVVF